MTDTEILDQPLPGMPDVPEPELLWAVYNAGADEFVAHATRRDAELFKSLLDDLDAKNADRPAFPTCAAEIVHWPWSAEEHADALRREAEGN